MPRTLTIKQVVDNWPAVTIAAALISFGWYASAEVAELHEARELAIENTKALQEVTRVVASLVREKELEEATAAQAARIRELEVQLFTETVVEEVTESVEAAVENEFETAAENQ